MQFTNVWDMYETNGLKQIQEILAIDRILHEQTLEIDWERPEAIILRKADLESIQNATIRVRSANDTQSIRSIDGHNPKCMDSTNNK